MAIKMRVVALVVGLVGLQTITARAADQETINLAVERGVAYLKSIQQSGGSWEHERNVGATALAALTLLECEVPRTDPAIQKAAQFVRAGCVHQRHTYSISLALLFLDHLGDGQDAELLEVLTKRLVRGQNALRGWGYYCPVEEQEVRSLTSKIKDRDGQAKKQDGANTPGDGGKPFPIVGPGRGGQIPLVNPQFPPQGDDQFANFDRPDGDNSNTQFATLALWVAHRHKFPLPVDNALARVEKRFRVCQNADGGWSYVLPLPGSGAVWMGTTPSMTCAGLLGLGIAYGVGRDTVLRSTDLNLKNRKTPAGKPEEPPDPNKDPSIRAGLLALGKLMQGAFAAGQRVEPGIGFGANGAAMARPPQGSPQNPQKKWLEYYTFWSIERVAMIFGLKTIGKVDWYAWGSDLLVNAQNADGSWMGSYGKGGCDTCFALLFLLRSNLTSDLSDSLRGKMIDPGEVKLSFGGVGGESLKNRDHPPVLTESPGGEDKAKSGSLPSLIKPTSPVVAEPKRAASPARSTGDAGLDEEAARLSAELVRASAEQQSAVLKKLREGKGTAYSEALAVAIPQLTGADKTKAREALAERMARMKASTLREKFRDEDLEIRRAAALASSMIDDKSFVPDLIKLLDDPEPPVARAAHAGLKGLTDKDFGPGDDASRAERKQAVNAWKAWWKQQGGAPAAPADVASDQDDSDKLQGVWIVIRSEGNIGNQTSEAVKKELLQFTFDGDQFSTKVDGGETLEKMLFKIDPARKPKEIDFSKSNDRSVNDKIVSHGIYAWEDGQLKLCLSDAGSEHPKEFKSKGNGKQVVFILKRKKS